VRATREGKTDITADVHAAPVRRPACDGRRSIRSSSNSASGSRALPSADGQMDHNDARLQRLVARRDNDRWRLRYWAVLA